MAAASGDTREKAKYTGELTKAAIRRVQSEIMDLRKNPLHADGIFVQHCDQLHACKALIIGPPETPYQAGFYLFDIKYPNTYPWDPPKVTFMTSDRRVRLNPNLYVGGKVCLSILGTWSGPPWTAALTIRTVMLCIQSLLHAHPLQNEPAFAKVTGERDERYSRILSYENIVVAVLRMLDRMPEGFEGFAPHLGYYFLRSLGVYSAVLRRLSCRQGQEEESPLGAFRTTYDPASALLRLEEWARKLRSDSALMRRIEQLEAEMRAIVPDLPSVFGGEAAPSGTPSAAAGGCGGAGSRRPLGDAQGGACASAEASSSGCPAGLSVQHEDVVISTSEAPEAVTGSPSEGGLGLRGLCRCFLVANTQGRSGHS